MQKEIIIGQRGWVWVGDVTRTAEEVTIENAFNVRRWGTTKGIGQLAIEGPQPNTALDPCPTVTLHPLAVIGAYKCNPEKWK
jgi:hypothetical protein